MNGKGPLMSPKLLRHGDWMESRKCQKKQVVMLITLYCLRSPPPLGALLMVKLGVYLDDEFNLFITSFVIEMEFLESTFYSNLQKLLFLNFGV